MKIPVILISALVVLLLVSTCYYDSVEYLFPEVNNQCDTTNITFALSVKPIFQNNCYNCHSNNTSSQGGNIKLEDYADVKRQADNGHLFGALDHKTGYSQMPLGLPKLDSCKLAVIKKWIDAKAPNN
jgi:hypothetical protein